MTDIITQILYPERGKIQQMIKEGPKDLLRRRVTLILSDEEAIALAVKILYELVPFELLKVEKDKLLKISNEANK